MLTYKAAYRALDEGVHAELVDFPGVISCGSDLDDARRMIALALVDMAEALLAAGASLPRPDPDRTDPQAELEEPVHLVLSASTTIEVAARG